MKNQKQSTLNEELLSISEALKRGSITMEHYELEINRILNIKTYNKELQEWDNEELEREQEWP